MAQVCGDTSFDFDWERQHEAALRTLRKAADQWAIKGADALPADAVIAVLLRIYLSKWPRYGGIKSEVRSLKSRLDTIISAREELLRLRPKVDLSILGSLANELSFAVNQWSLGDPELPPTAHVINAVEHVLFSNKLTRRPPSPKLPVTLLAQELNSSNG